jgi:hypothetical protein
VTTSSSLVIGTLQATALVPGVSRSGITIVGGLLCGLTARPPRASRSAVDPRDPRGGRARRQAHRPGDPAVVLSGMVAAAVSGYLAIGSCSATSGAQAHALRGLSHLAGGVHPAWWLTRGCREPDSDPGGSVSGAGGPGQRATTTGPQRPSEEERRRPWPAAPTVGPAKLEQGCAARRRRLFRAALLLTPCPARALARRCRQGS